VGKAPRWSIVPCRQGPRSKRRGADRQHRPMQVAEYAASLRREWRGGQKKTPGRGISPTLGEIGSFFLTRAACRGTPGKRPYYPGGKFGAKTMKLAHQNGVVRRKSAKTCGPRRRPGDIVESSGSGFGSAACSTKGSRGQSIRHSGLKLPHGAWGGGGAAQIRSSPTRPGSTWHLPKGSPRSPEIRGRNVSHMPIASRTRSRPGSGLNDAIKRSDTAKASQVRRGSSSRGRIRFMGVSARHMLRRSHTCAGLEACGSGKKNSPFTCRCLRPGRRAMQGKAFYPSMKEHEDDGRA